MTEATKTRLLPIQTKKILVLILALFMLLAAAYSLLRFGFSVDILDRSGWHAHNGSARYQDYFGCPQLGWQYIENKLYYFDAEGNMVTGWQEIGGSRYYFGQDGVRAVGWQTVDNTTYYLGSDGKVVSGWQVLDGKHYLFADTGAMATGWQTVGGNRSYFSQEGAALTGWQEIDGKQYYFTQEGHPLTGAVEIDGILCRLAEDGAAIAGWYSDETGKYYLNEKGQSCTGIQEIDGKRYYFGENGVMLTGWMVVGNDRYYLNEDGTMAIGKAEVDGKTHFFTSKGKWVLLANPWNPVPEDYEVKLVSIEGFRFDSTGRDSLQKMLEACRAAGLSCVINNTYRSKATQQYFWDRSVDQYLSQGMSLEAAKAQTGKSIAIPGHSEHQTGLAVDLNGSDATYAWLAEYCWDYGFILRYPDNKIDITGIIYEPWHFRYVGTELSLELKALGITMEEYLESITPAA